MSDTSREFEAFHCANPDVYRHLVKFAFQAVRSGRKRTSITLLVNRVRWYVDVETNGSGDFKINDHFSPYYARLLMAEYEELAGMFELRKSEADEWVATCNRIRRAS